MHYCLWECVNGAASVGSSLAVSQKVKHRITTQPRNSIPKQKPKKNEDMFSLFLSLTHTLKKKIYLFESQSHRKRGRDKMGSSTHWLTTQKATTARASPGRTQQPGASSRSPSSLREPKLLADILLFFSNQQGTKWKVEYLGPVLLPTWDASIGSNLQFCTTHKSFIEL